MEKILEEIDIPLELCSTIIRFYVKVNAKIKCNSQWLIDIKCNIGVTQRQPLSHIFQDPTKLSLEDERWHWY